MGLNFRTITSGIRILPRIDGSTAPTVQGDLAVSSVDGKLYYNNGSVIVALVGESTSSTITNKTIIVSGPGANTFNDGTDNTKEILFDASTASTGTILTLGDNQTTSQRINFPNVTATDTLVTNNFPAVLTNKTISGASNTITNIPAGSLTGTVALINGGTGIAAGSANAAFDALSPMTTVGDIIYEDATPTAVRLPIGSSGQVLTVTAGIPSWMTPSPGFQNPMTTAGDIIVGGVGGAAQRLGATTNGFILTLVSGTPAWVANSGGSAPNSVGTFDSQAPSANGLVIASNTLYAQSASATVPGMVNNTTQTFSGAKTFSTSISSPSVHTASLSDSGSGLTIGSSSGQNITITAGTGGSTIITSPLTLSQIATPSNPASGFNDIYFKSDNNLYILNSSGIETLIGTPSENTIAWSGYHTSATGNAFAIPAGSTYTDLTNNDATVTLHQGNNSNFGTVTGYGATGPSSSALPGFVFTPTVTGLYFVKACLNINSDASPNSLRLTDGTNIIDSTPMVYPQSPTTGQFVALSGILNVTSLSPVSIRIQGASGSVGLSYTSPATGSHAIDWAIFLISGSGSGGGSGVSSLNSLTGALNITAGSGISVTPSGSSIQITNTGSSYTFADSLVNTGGTVTLVGDTASPGASEYYGTNGSSVLGYYALPSGTISGLTTDGVVYATSATTVASTSAGTAGQVLTSNGTGVAPTYQNSSGGNPFDYFASTQITTNSSGITATSFTTFSNDPGFSFTPNFTGKYKVYCSAPIESTVHSDTAYIQIVNTVGGATLLNGQPAVIFTTATGAILSNILTQAVFSLNSGTAYTFAIQGMVDPGGECFFEGAACNSYIFAERIG